VAYASQQDLIDRYGEDELIQLTDRANLPATTIDAAVVSAAIRDAENLADSYIAKKYQVPLVPVPDVLIPMICQIGRYYLHGRRLDKDDPVTRDFERAIAWLKDVANGTVQLEADGKTSGQSGGGAVQVSAPGRIFSRDTLGGF
jgi:phage gp36-like protein